MKSLIYQTKEVVTKSIKLNASIIAEYITKLTNVKITSDEVMEIWSAKSPETSFFGTKFDFSIEHPLKCVMTNFVEIVIDLIYEQIHLCQDEEKVLSEKVVTFRLTATEIGVGDHIKVIIPDTTITTEGIVTDIRVDDYIETLYGTWGDFGVNSYSDFIQLMED